MNAVSVKGLTKRYQEHPAVDNISFDVKEGEFFAFLGENGAGKSTTINILCTILEKSGGEVEIFGHELGREDDAIREKIGIVFQNSVLDPKLSVRENLLSRASYYGLSKAEVSRRLEPFMDRFELKEIWNRAYERLSGGQRRRVDIIRALLNDPKILFLDEPTTGLDPMSRKIVWDYIEYLRKEKKMTLFLTTHYMEEVRDADRVIVIDRGKIIAEDSPLGLKNRFTVSKLIWYTDKGGDKEKVLEGRDFYFDGDHYIVKIPRDKETYITEYLYKNRDVITDYELIKGTMDDVFLTLTGRKMGE